MSVHTKFETARLETAKLAPARRSTRTRVLMVATLVTCSGSQRVRIRDFSSKGAQVVLEGGKLAKCDVLLKRGELCAAAQVAWVKGDEAGITFYREVSADELAAS
jgi:hypothetical protein